MDQPTSHVYVTRCRSDLFYSTMELLVLLTLILAAFQRRTCNAEGSQ
ncbi:uncharacterized protein CPUR_06144 [Claviceps purpurea 20.1]|uniref:Uncharacterized protein n=1 Tax=Claviceps purpurea (strain 20.1) TaxID=1111077 RepID=M1WH12_CLAP2|nr:uncharacterized protein CPUR_06144 [Claviceps purpurea 20.1]